MTDALPYRMYLLAHDASARGPYDRRRTGFLVRAAVLVELALRGHLVPDDDGAVRRAAEAAPTGDPVLDEVLREAAGRPHGWKTLVRRHRERTLRAVEDRLAALGPVSVDQRAGPFARRRVTVSDPAAVRALTARAAAVLHATGPAAEVDAADAALVVLSAAGHVPSVAPRRDTRAHRARIDALTGRLGAVAPGLETAVRGLRTTMIAAQGGMGGS
ncbi:MULTISPECIES: GPP34 family phosphoprotein [unclassified Streptomyces]|uniref:GOLPH3/VPS74 family protein n=1 Tax=unclassified Streptomyces TaxID=2593676 RepID=UPI00382188C4